MTKIISTHGFEVNGKLIGFDEAGEDMRFKFAPNIEVEIRRPEKRMIATLARLGLHALQNATLNFQANRIDLNTGKESPGTTTAVKPDMSVPIGLK